MSYGQDTDEATRNARDSVFLHAMVSSNTASVQFRVRNISSSGLMAEGPLTFDQGDEVDVDLRNIGRIHGKVVWIDEGRFGMAFDRSIDPKQARKPVGGGRSSPSRY